MSQMPQADTTAFNIETPEQPIRTDERQQSSAEYAAHDMPFGAQVQLDGSVRFRVWAPEASSLSLVLEDQHEPLPMRLSHDGWYELTTALAQASSRYKFLLPTGMQVPDPASRYQPQDVNGPSEVIDPAAYRWRSTDWLSCGWEQCTWEQAVIYELHIGTFTQKGTFLAAIERLDDLLALGITAIEIMSLGDFAGRWGWGYDGVLLYAPDSSYGRPEDLKALVDAAHERGMMVILDVVYNHFGPEGNYIALYFPDIVTKEYSTPWGQALNFDARHSEQTRQFIIHNALYWVEEFRMDGLRLDAVHAIIDSSSTHILDELATAVRAVAGGRPIHLILESDDKVWHHLSRNQAAEPISSTAQWNHDIQKLTALSLTSGRSEEDDIHDLELVGTALIEGFTSGPHHRNAPANALSLHVEPGGFISFLQTHDIVGNRIRGERLTQLAPARVVRAINAVYLLAPQVPMLFMGEEWGASTPFPYFCDFSGDLADAVRKGRLEQFATLAEREDPAYLKSIPDPLARSTFLSAKLNWAERASGAHADWLDWYTRILQVRHETIVPLLKSLHTVRGKYHVLGPRQISVQWQMERTRLRLDANLCDCTSDAFEPKEGKLFWIEGSETGQNSLHPWSVRWSLT